MRGFNRAIIAGNLTQDPEVRYTVNKKAYARFGVAVNNRYKDSNGEFKENTDFINVVAWGNNAETCGKYLKKGHPILIEGRIRTGSYDAKDGSGKRYTTEIWVDNMIMLGYGQQGNNSGGGTYSRGASQNSGGSYIPSDDDFGQSMGSSGGFGESFAQDNDNGSPEEDAAIPF